MARSPSPIRCTRQKILRYALEKKEAPLSGAIQEQRLRSKRYQGLLLGEQVAVKDSVNRAYVHVQIPQPANARRLPVSQVGLKAKHPLRSVPTHVRKRVLKLETKKGGPMLEPPSEKQRLRSKRYRGLLSGEQIAVKDLVNRTYVHVQILERQDAAQNKPTSASRTEDAYEPSSGRTSCAQPYGSRA